ncbi:phage tail tube protein [Actinocorallia sp. API 0066]|uniref:phage tail tube protein n=1 Tax=Actinocorallia sp. API 0066 TaxID=2896846 RepID=UPI001E405237|nr:phage tail tube protein [Actinocorallia sp. API 0066]MCD0450765.1 phage tail tube protein [Actinocorallia sp. API 0066]
MAGIDGFGTKFLRGNGATPTEAFVAIAEVTNVTPPGMSRDTYDVTSHDSPNRRREFIGGLVDAGEVSIEINYDPALHDVLVADFDDVDPRNYQIQFPDPALTTWTFAAIMTGFEPEAPHDDKLSASVTFKVSGAPDLSEES